MKVLGKIVDARSGVTRPLFLRFLLIIQINSYFKTESLQFYHKFSLGSTIYCDTPYDN